METPENLPVVEETSDAPQQVSKDVTSPVSWRQVVVALAVLGAIVIGYMAWKGFSTTATEEFRVRLGWVHQAQFAGMYVAKEKGFYAEAGLDVELLPADLSINQTEELANGDVEASVMEAHQLLGDGRVGELKAVAAIYQINPHALAARADSDIKTPADFSGKVIGLAGGKSEGGTIFEIFIKGLNLEEDVTYKDLGFNTVDDFLNQRADVIDVYRIDQPYLATRAGVPLTIIPLDAYGFSTYGDLLVVRDSFIEDNSEATRRFVQATLRGWEHALEHPDEAVEITLQYAEGDYADKEYQEHIMFESIPLVRGNATTLGSMDLVPWSTLYESMRRAGAVEENLNVSDIYTNAFIE